MTSERRRGRAVKASEHVCIYCGEQKPAALFNREHVIPEAFGTFEHNFVLRCVVCRQCNDYFGQHLDLQLGRQTVEGLERYQYGLKQPEGKTAFGRGALLTARVDDGGFYDGASVWFGPSEDGTRLLLYPFPQVGFCNDERRCWFPADKIPTKEQLHALGFTPGEDLDLRTFGVESEDAEGRVMRELVEKGYKPTKLELAQVPIDDEEVHIEIKVTVDRTIQRAIAKIAFNYLAYHFARIARMEAFADTRRYIRYDAKLPRRVVSMERSSTIEGVPRDQAPLGYIVAVSWEQGQVVARVTLFFRFHYRVLLADGGFAIHPEFIQKAHFFDPINGRIRELRKTSQRSRPRGAA